MKDAPAPADRYPGPRTKRQRTMTTSIRERLDAMRAFYAEGHTREPAFRKEYLRRPAGGRKGTRARDSGSPVRRPAQIGGRVVYQRDGHCAGRNTRPTAASGAPGPQPAGAYPALPLPLREPHHSGTAGGGACHGAVELSLPAPPSTRWWGRSPQGTAWR